MYNFPPSKQLNRSKSFEFGLGRIVFLIFVFSIVLFEAGALFFWGQRSVVGGTSYEKYADEIIETCSGFDYRPTCYDKEIPKLTDTLSMEETFEVTRFVTQKDPGYLHCHVLAHYLSENETAKDPTKWKDVVARCPIAMCNNGCPHGALMQGFKNDSGFLTEEQIEEVKPDLEDVCEPRDGWRPAEEERAMCYHGLGHLNMYITDANIDKSLEICNQVGVKDDGRNYIQTCTAGVFMSVFQPLGPEDRALVDDIRPLKEEVSSFCDGYSGEAFNACMRESWPFFHQEVLEPHGLTNFCSYTDDYQEQKKCYGTVMNMITVYYITNKDDLEGLSDFCSGLPEEWTGICFSNSARRLIQIDALYTDKALDVCLEAKNKGVGDECYDILVGFGAINFHVGSEEFIKYCSSFPSPLDKKCLGV